MRLTEYHCGKAVLKNKDLDSKAAAKLATYEDIDLDPEDIIKIGDALSELSESLLILAGLSKIGKDVHKHLEIISVSLKEVSESIKGENND